MRKFLFAIIAIALLSSVYFFWPFGKKFEIKQPFALDITDSGNDFPTMTSASTVSEFLAEKKIALGEKDYVFPAPEAKIFPRSRITIRRAMPVAIEVDGKTVAFDTLGTSVQDAIGEADITLSHADKVMPERTALLSPDMNIKITRINFEEITAEEDIPFQTVEKEDSTVLWRKKETKQKGEKGVREKTYKITYTNGKETNRQLVGTKITKTPVSEIDVVGTKIVVGKTQTGGATWYTNGDGLTCASLDFAHGKYLRVTNKSNGKSVIVQVNDSGPYGKGRVIDLNKKAFQKIGDIGKGVINVKVEEILN
ncbi:MAG TPA: G5 domain-containing protein [Candidatus Bathyarchaeia archaeon]|nr:G5 domain-containing protein [Candidatus Bathyarchaeia archaeon]